MKKILTIVLFATALVYAGFDAKISKIDATIKHRMYVGNSYRKGCPVALRDLRYLRLTYKNFKGKDVQGELIVHKLVAKDVVEVFRSLYNIGYPIHKMRLVSKYHGKDWHSIEADNTSAFNCRNVGGTNRWSKHSYGKAIDINPIENPYISSSGHISHKASLKYRKRVHKNWGYADRAVLLKNDKATQIFTKHGWKWGGTFRREKDYQHFAK